MQQEALKHLFIVQELDLQNSFFSVIQLPRHGSMTRCEGAVYKQPGLRVETLPRDESLTDGTCFLPLHFRENFRK